MKKIKNEFTIPPSIEPLRTNRYICNIIKLGDNKESIEPYRIQEINLGQHFHEMKIIEIINHRNIFKTIERNENVVYNINFLDPVGEVVETLLYKGVIQNVELNKLSYNSDNILATHIQIGNIENVK